MPILNQAAFKFWPIKTEGKELVSAWATMSSKGVLWLFGHPTGEAVWFGEVVRSAHTSRPPSMASYRLRCVTVVILWCPSAKPEMKRLLGMPWDWCLPCGLSEWIMRATCEADEYALTATQEEAREVIERCTPGAEDTLQLFLQQVYTEEKWSP